MKPAKLLSRINVAESCVLLPKQTGGHLIKWISHTARPFFHLDKVKPFIRLAVHYIEIILFNTKQKEFSGEHKLAKCIVLIRRYFMQNNSRCILFRDQYDVCRNWPFPSWKTQWRRTQWNGFTKELIAALSSFKERVTLDFSLDSISWYGIYIFFPIWIQFTYAVLVPTTVVPVTIQSYTIM